LVLLKRFREGFVNAPLYRPDAAAGVHQAKQKELVAIFILAHDLAGADIKIINPLVFLRFINGGAHVNSVIVVSLLPGAIKPFSARRDGCKAGFYSIS
jgi:hypothetical protein